MPVRADIRLGVEAARTFASHRDVPDVLGFEDFAAHSDMTLELVRQRIRNDSSFVDVHFFPLPKPSGGVRGVTVMNPIDEFSLRTYVGRCSRAILNSTDTDCVLNGIIRRPGPGWFAADFRQQSRSRRELQRAFYDVPATKAVGFFDVKDFYKSCGHDQLSDLLLTAGAPGGAVARLRELLSGLYSSGVGLPIGFEGSGPLANLFLTPVDRHLTACGIPFVRWTDDLDTFLRSTDQWDSLRESVESLVNSVGLRLNETKVAMIERGPQAENRLLDPARDSFLMGDAVENASTRFDAELWARNWGLDVEMAAPHFRSRLGMLRGRAHPGALPYLMATPQWLDAEPRVVGDYLSALAADAASRKLIDQDWLIERAVDRTPTKNTAAGQLHLCRALSNYGPGKQAGSKLLDFAFSAGIAREYSALGSWSVRAWASSQHWKPKDFHDVVTSSGHGYGRAAAAGLLRRGGAQDRRRLKALALEHRNLAPAIHWASAQS